MAWLDNAYPESADASRAGRPVAGSIEPPSVDRVAPVITFVEGVELIQLNEVPTLFAGPNQALYALDPLGTFVAEQISADGATLAAVSVALSALGHCPAQSRAAVDAAIRLWIEAGLVDVGLPPLDRARAPSATVNLANLPFTLRYGSERLRNWLAPPIASVEWGGDTAGSAYHVSNADDAVFIARSGRATKVVDCRYAVTALKACLVDGVLAATKRLALHAAALERDGRAILLSGDPGAGKSTLALALSGAGLGYMSDDVVLLDRRGSAQGLCFHPTLKQGAWDLFPDWAEIERSVTHERRDGARVKYIHPRGAIVTAGRAVGWIALLRRREGSAARLVAADPMAVLRELLRGGHTRSGRMGASDLRMLVNVIGGAHCWELHYSDLRSAADLVLRSTAA